MNTVDALNVLGKALCGDSFEVKPGLTDAETILEIAKNYEGGGSDGGEEPNVIWVDHTDGTDTYLPAGLSWKDFVGAYIADREKPTEEEPQTHASCTLVTDVDIPLFTEETPTEQFHIRLIINGMAREYIYDPTDGLYWPYSD